MYILLLSVKYFKNLSYYKITLQIIYINRNTFLVLINSRNLKFKKKISTKYNALL